MTSDMLLTALGEIGEDLVAEAREGGAARKRSPRRYAKLLVAAAAAILVMATIAIAATTGPDDPVAAWFDGRLQSLSGGTMSSAQVALVDELTQELGVSVTNAGYTVTAETVTVGREGLTLLFSISPVEGSLDPLLKYNISLRDTETMLDGQVVEGSHMGNTKFYRLDEEENKAYVIMDYAGDIPEEAAMADRFELDIQVEQLTISSEDFQKDGTYVNGNWDMTIPLKVNAWPETIELPDTTVRMWSIRYLFFLPAKAEVYDISLSETDMNYTYSSKNKRLQDGGLISFAQVVLKDGTVIPSDRGGSHRQGDTNTCTNEWVVPVDLSEVAYVQFGQTKIPVTLP